MSSEKTKAKDESAEKERACCTSEKCCDGGQVAKFLRYIADYFDKKSK